MTEDENKLVSNFLEGNPDILIRHREADVSKKKLRYAFNKVLEVAENARCEDLHHPKKHQHSAGEACKVEYHINRQAHIVREYMKEQGIER